MDLSAAGAPLLSWPKEYHEYEKECTRLSSYGSADAWAESSKNQQKNWKNALMGQDVLGNLKDAFNMELFYRCYGFGVSKTSRCIGATSECGAGVTSEWHRSGTGVTSERHLEWQSCVVLELCGGRNTGRPKRANLISVPGRGSERSIGEGSE